MEHLKKLLLAGVVAICCFGANAALTNSGVLYVSPSGNDTTARSGQIEFPYKTLTNAFAKLAISNTVVMQPGTYDLGTNRLKLLTGCSLVGAGPTATIINSSVLGANDDIRPTIVLNDNVTVQNFTLRCVTNGNDKANNPDHWQAIGNRTTSIGDKAGYTNYFINNVCFENPMIDCFYIGEDDTQHQYSGVVNNCFIMRDKPAHWDIIAVGGTNSSHTFNNCTFYAGMKSANEGTLATFTRLSGSAKLSLNNCYFEWTNVIVNATGTAVYAPFISETGAYAAGGRTYINGGVFTAYLISATPTATDNPTNVIGSFLYSTNGTTYRTFVSNGADNNTSVSGVGYTVILTASANTTPANTTTYFIGGCPGVAANTVYGTASVDIPRSGTIKRVFYKVRCGTVDTTEANGVVNTVRLNNTTDFASQTFALTQAATNVVVSGLSQAVSAGDTIVWKALTPGSWSIAPAGVHFYAIVYIE